MYGLGYISQRVNDQLTTAPVLGAPGDVYLITDTRERGRKELDEIKSLQRYKIEKYDGSEGEFANENGVILYPVLDLNFDTRNFQNRDSEYSETSVNRIIDAVEDGDFNWAIFDPITIWRNPTDGKYYVLSGHSRSEAFRRLAMSGAQADGRKFDRIPAKVFAGTFEQAKELALNSNTLSTKETDLERANYYRERREKLKSNGLKNSEIRKRLLELARKNEGKNATKIIYLSYLNPRGLVVDAVSNTSDGASIDKNRVAVMAEWVGHLRHDYPQLTDFHETELFNFLKNGHYGVDVKNFAEFAKRVQTAIEKHTEWGVFDAAKSLNLEKNLGKSENEKRYDAELQKLKEAWIAADDTLTRKLAEFKARQKKDSSITDAQIVAAARPYKDSALLAKAAYLAFRDKRGDFLRADEKQLSLFGFRPVTLGKPTIKFEFESNNELADFLKNTQEASHFSEYTDVTGKGNSTGKRAAKKDYTIHNGYLMPGTGSKFLPESSTPILPPSPTSPKQLPPAPTSPTTQTSTQSDETPEVTAENVTDEEIETSNVTPVEIDWKAFEDAFAKASNWSSFDPERSARSYVGGYKETYDKYVKQVPTQYRNSFDWFVKRYVADLVSKRSRTASAAVTGPGGIDAKKAASLNRANDRFMEASVQFPYILSNYIHKLQLREKRKAFVNSSIDERNAARIKELESDVNGLKYYKKLIQHISQGGEIPDDVRQSYWYFSKDSYGGEPKFRDNVVNALQYRLNLNKATFKDKLTREVTNGNVEIVDAIIESLKPLGLFTNRAEIWQFPSFARTRRQSVNAEQQRVENNAQSENSLYRVEYDTQEDRVKIFFNGMPSDKIRTYLKSNGFRWSPRNKAWQRQITENARRAVRQFESLVADGTLSGTLGKPTIKLEFENNAELMRLFDTSDINGIEPPAAIFNCPESQLDTAGYYPTYKRLASYDHLIDSADGVKKLVGYGFENATLKELADACQYYPQVARLAAHLKAATPVQSAFNIWHWLHTNVKYNYDAPGVEEIRTPARTYADRFSGVDCDCLAVFTACLLINMGYRPEFEIVAFNGSPKFSHIYVNLDGVAIDRVLPTFNQRPPHITKTQIMEIPVYQLSGCHNLSGLAGLYESTLAKINSGTATADDSVNFRKAQVLVSLQGCDYNAYRLAGILMPHVATIDDNGHYYFHNGNVARVASVADSELRNLEARHVSGDALNGWFQTVAKKVETASAVPTIKTAGNNAPTVIVIVNPKRQRVPVAGEMVKADCCKCNPLTTNPQLFTEPPTASTPAPSEGGEPEDNNNAGIWALVGLVGAMGAAIARSGKKKSKNKKR